jgi:hypothetical protein
MWDPRLLTTLWASTVCCRDNFSLFYWEMSLLELRMKEKSYFILFIYFTFMAFVIRQDVALESSDQTPFLVVINALPLWIQCSGVSLADRFWKEYRWRFKIIIRVCSTVRTQAFKTYYGFAVTQIWLSFAVQWLQSCFLLCYISDFRPYILIQALLCFRHSLQAMPGYCLKHGRIVSFHIVSYSSVTIHPTTRRFIICAVERASVNYSCELKKTLFYNWQLSCTNWLTE